MGILRVLVVLKLGSVGYIGSKLGGYHNEKKRILLVDV